MGGGAAVRHADGHRELPNTDGRKASGAGHAELVFVARGAPTGPAQVPAMVHCETVTLGVLSS